MLYLTLSCASPSSLAVVPLFDTRHLLGFVQGRSTRLESQVSGRLILTSPAPLTGTLQRPQKFCGARQTLLGR